MIVPAGKHDEGGGVMWYDMPFYVTLATPPPRLFASTKAMLISVGAYSFLRAHAHWVIMQTLYYFMMVR